MKIAVGELTRIFPDSPMCPQNYIDAAYLLRIPESLDDGFNAAQDEFNCLNLDIVMPNPRIVTGAGKLLPVVMWIHGTISNPYA